MKRRKLRRDSPRRRKPKRPRLPKRLLRSSKSIKLRSSSRMRSSITKRPTRNSTRRRKPECKLRRTSRMSRLLRSQLRAPSAKKKRRN